MKIKIYKYLSLIAVAGALFSVSSCNKFLDIEPSSQITPENYLKEESQLAAYTVNMYNWLPDHISYGGIGYYGADESTDNQVGSAMDKRFLDGEHRIDISNGSSQWNFEHIYEVNYFLDIVLPRWKNDKIIGNKTKINHSIGEAYFFRAFTYFDKLKAMGDFPIVKRALTNDFDELVKATKRSPRSEVARFILSDLDSAIMFLQPTSPDGRNNQLSQQVAQLVKSRVALYEASWLTNFKGTAFVPGTSEWPGAKNHPDFAYESGSIDAEIEYLLKEAMKSSKVVADAAQLTDNTGITPQPENENNPYFWMFATTDMSSYPEVMLWKEYNISYGIKHMVNAGLVRGNNNIGLTRGLVMQFLDKNGLPWYDSNALFTDDSDVNKLRENRDSRISLFLKEPGQINIWKNPNIGLHKKAQEAVAPPVFLAADGDMYITGYCTRKGAIPDGAIHATGTNENAAAIFRSAEALLNYIEASYMLNGNLDADATKYWTALRTRAGITTPIETTINAIDVAKEAQFDWAAYSAGVLIDPTMMAIRKERRSEYMCEGFRFDDLKRWRALDQLMTQPYDIEGMKIWNSSNYDLYSAEAKAAIIYGEENPKSTVSDPKYGDYMKIYKVVSNNLAFNGVTWHLAHYLEPIEIENFIITSNDGNAENSVIYQNPYWGLDPSSSAIK